MAFLLEFSPSIASHKQKRTLISNENDFQGSEALFSQFSKGLQKLGVTTSVLRSPHNLQSFETVFSVKLPLDQKLLFRVSANLRYQSVSLVASICNGWDYISPRSSELHKNCCKTVKKINSISYKTINHLALHPHSGQILLKSHIHFPTLSEKNSLLGLLRLITHQSVRSICVFAPLLLYTCNLLPRSSVVNGLSQSLKSVILGPQGELMQMADIYELLPLTSCELRSQQDKKSNKNSDTGVNCRKIIELYYKQRDFSRDACLFQEPNLLQVQVPINHEFTSQAFRKYLMSTNGREQNKQTPTKEIEHTHIFNTISVNSGSRGRERLVGQGNRARILGLQLQYTFASSMNADRTKNTSGKAEDGEQSTEETDQIEKRHQFDRILAIKVPKATQNESLKRKMFEQIRYEKTILQNFRGSVSHYLARYYHSVQKTFEYRNCLLMDYISGNNLGDQLQLKSETISLSSKLNILVHLANAIRFLERYQVAHLDISPGNVMVVKDYVKIIDFGQAYHPVTTPKFTGINGNRSDYSPGRTFPYCPPETSQRVNNFTSKQDLYSIGIICYKMLFGCVPYSCDQHTLEQSLKNKSYLLRIFVAPQRGENYGQRELISALLALIFKMIRPEEQLRPLPAWAHILFRKLYMALR